jgi:hypothetical protein
MKKIIFFSAVLILSYIINTPVSQATVGGPTYINNIQTDASGQEIIYEVMGGDGRGCPPEIYSYNISTGSTKVLLSCNDSERLSNFEYETELELTMSKYPVILKRIDLNKNKITAEAVVTGEQEYDESLGNWGKTDFSIDIFQDGIKKMTKAYSGCKPEQQQIIEGYRIPNSKNMVLVLSTVTDCFEGGYLGQNPFIVPNITVYDATSLSITKNQAPTPGNGRISLIASKTASTDTQASIASIDRDTNMGANTEAGIDNEMQNKTNGDSGLPALNYQIFIGILLVIILALIFRKSTK